MLQIPSNTKKEKPNRERECVCVTRVWNPMTIIDVIWYVVVEREKSRGSGGCEVKRMLDVGDPVRSQGLVLGYKRE